MKWFEQFIAKKLASYKPLEESIKKCSRISLPEGKKQNMKMHILDSFKANKPVEEFGFANLIAKIKFLAAQIKPTEYFRILLREKLITLVEFQKQVSFGQFHWRSSRRIFASVIALVFILAIFFNFSVNVSRVEASLVTILEEVQGEVVVIRDGITLRATENFFLKADDIVRTGQASKVVIRFLDQSVSRLAENTEIKISKLFSNPLNKTQTIVELVLQHGRLWSRVISLIDDFSHFQVKVKNTVAVAKKKAAFDVSISSKGKAKVSAVHNKVELLVPTDKKVLETTLVKGFSAEMKTDISVAPRIKSDEGVVSDDTWISDNLAQDKKYIEEIKQETQEKLREQGKLFSNSPLSIALTFDDFEKQNKILQSAAEKLASAQVLLEKGDQEKAIALLAEFQAQVQSVFDWVKLHEVDRSIAAVQLTMRIQEMLDSYQKQFVLILPNDSLYKLKEAVAATKINIAPDLDQKTQEKLEQASEKLSEAYDLIEQGDRVGAEEQVQAYSKAIAEFASEAKKLPSDDKEKAVSAMLGTKVDDLKSLQAIAEPSSSSLEPLAPELLPVLSGTSTTATLPETFGTSSEAIGGIEPLPTVSAEDFQKTLADAKTEALTVIGEAVLDLQQEQPSAEVLEKLQNINNIDVNGKSVVNVKLTGDQVTIKSDGTVISVGTTTPLSASSKTQVSPQVQP